MMITQKKCFKCGAEKPLSEFYKHKEMKDGHLNKCKECAKKDSTARRREKIDDVRAYDRSRGSRQEASYLRAYRGKNKKIYKAHNAVSRAIKDGRLTPEPCCVCGSTEKLEAHHDDYNEPLTVRWMCSAHHKQWHRDSGKGKNSV